MPKTEPFNNYLKEYENWFADNHYVFLSELEAIKRLLPSTGRGVEIGVGSGIFAATLGIKEGCDPSEKMRDKALERGIDARDCIAEALPYPDDSFNFALMVTTICFVDDPHRSIKEIYRILKPEGQLIMGFVDKDSRVGKQYLKEKEKSLFYREAVIFSSEEIKDLLQQNGFRIERTLQTVFGMLHEINEIQKPENQTGNGSFVVIKAIKN